MTDDTDERMERAERIRELREQSGEDRAADAPAAEGHGEAAGGTESVGGSEPAPPSGGGGGDAGLELPDEDQIQAALEEAGGAAETAEPAEDAEVGGTARRQAGSTVSKARTRVLEFELGEEYFCIDIDGIEEIVKRETVTRVPNTPPFVEGVVDLRGQITTILDAKGLLDMGESGAEELIVVFAPEAYEEYGAVGWIVDEVRQVLPVRDEQVRESPTDDEYVEGVVDREDADELVVWVRPEVAMNRTIAVEGEE